MPILWRLLLSWYFKAFILATLGLVALLMATRLHDIASLASLGMSPSSLGLYSLYQIPYILPIVVSFASFLASLLMGPFLFRSQEITALASCRLAFKEFFWPIAWASALIGLGNFYMTSEIATHTHLASRQLVLDLQKTSPLALLKRPELIDRGHFAAFGASTQGNISQDFAFVFFQPHQGRLALIRAKEIGVNEGLIRADGALLVTTKPSALLVENIGKTEASGDLFAWLGTSRRRLSPDHLTLRQLFSYAKEVPTKTPQVASEFGRRLAFGLAPFCLALFGLSLAPFRKVLLPILAALLAIASIFIAKTVESRPLIALLLQLGPQLVLLLLALFGQTLKRRKLR